MPTPASYQELYESSLREIALLQEKLAVALAEINHLRRQLFGRSADNRTTQAQPHQSIAPLEIGVSAQELQAIEAQTGQRVVQLQQAEKKAPKKREKNTRMVFPSDLPRQEIIIHPVQDLTHYVQIGQEITEILEVSPASFWVKRIIRTKWALKATSSEEEASVGILIAPIPSRTVARGLFRDSLLSQLVISKYVDHLPLHRQMKIFQRAGVQLAASTVSDNIAGVCRLLEPLYHSLQRDVLANGYLQADETPFRVQDTDKKDACHQGYQWAYHAPVSKLVLFNYQPGRGQEGPAKLLADFQGVLQTDGYVVYSSLFDKKPTVTLAACMAHVRRKFDEAVSYDAARATYAVAQIARLYAIEQHIRDAPDLDEPDICQKRLSEANPILEELKDWLDTEYGKVLPNSPIAVPRRDKAITYARKLWDRLTVYLYHGHLQIDNNLIENAIRPIALGRKNFLFAGSHAAAQNAAMLYSFLGSCQRNNVQPHQWLADVLEKLNDPEYEGKFSDLLPNRWTTPLQH